jgi:hypothetical protein
VMATEMVTTTTMIMEMVMESNQHRSHNRKTSNSQVPIADYCRR